MRDLTREAAHSAGNPAGNRFADDEKVGRDSDTARMTAGAAAQRVSLIDGKQRTMVRAQSVRGGPEPVLGQNHARVRHHGFGEHARDIAVRQFVFERRWIVELHDTRMCREVCDATDLACAIHDATVVGAHQCVIQRAVIAAVEDERFRALGHRTRPAQHGAIGVGRGLRHLPLRQSKAFRQ